MNELEALRQKKLEQLQKQQQEFDEFNQQVTALETYVKQHLTKEALSRYGNLKSAHPEKTVQALTVLTQLLQSGKVKIVNDELFKDILLRMEPQKHKFTLTRK